MCRYRRPDLLAIVWTDISAMAVSKNQKLRMLFPYEPRNVNKRDSCLGSLAHAYLFFKETQET